MALIFVTLITLWIGASVRSFLGFIDYDPHIGIGRIRTVLCQILKTWKIGTSCHRCRHCLIVERNGLVCSQCFKRVDLWGTYFGQQSQPGELPISFWNVRWFRHMGRFRKINEGALLTLPSRWLMLRNPGCHLTFARSRRWIRNTLWFWWFFCTFYKMHMFHVILQIIWTPIPFFTDLTLVWSFKCVVWLNMLY